MTENTQKPVSKLENDRQNDFKFRVAYDVYSRAWDENSSDGARLKLNELILSLSKSESDYSSFYAQIHEYRRDLAAFKSGRARIETQRKRDWQKTDARDRRNSRHR